MIDYKCIILNEGGEKTKIPVWTGSVQADNELNSEICRN